MRRMLYKQYYRCESQSEQIYGEFGQEVAISNQHATFNGLRNPDGSYSAAPAWFSHTGGFPVYTTMWSMAPPAETNTVYDFSWTIQDKYTSEDVEYLVRLTMIDYCAVPIGCDGDSTVKPLSVLTFLSREGGWPLFYFNGKKSFEDTIPEAKQYINTEYITYNNSRRGVFKGETLTATIEDIRALDLLESLKQSIQVYYIENITDDTNRVFKPVILLNNGEYTKRRTDDNLYEITLKFIYADEQQMQTQ